MTTEPTRTQMLSMEDVVRRCLFTPQHVRRLVREGRFPVPVKLGDGKYARIGFVDYEIEQWLQDRIAKRKEALRDLEAV